jgi:heptosyltransferase I
MRPSLSLGAAPRILLVRLGAIGDVVVTTPVARVLRQALPQAHLAWLVEEKAADVISGNPYLDEVIVWRWASWQREPIGSRLAHHQGFIHELRGRRFDVGIDFQGLARSAWLLPAAGIRHRIGNTRSREGSGLCYTLRVPRPLEPSSRQRCLDLLRPLGVESRDRRMVIGIQEEQRRHAAAFLERHGLAAAPYVCLCPATTWTNKHWIEERWAQLADALGRRLELRPVFMGSRADLPLLDRVRRTMTTDPVIAAGQTTLREAAALMERARAAVTVDTALMHIGVAVGTPVVALCGASNWRGFQDYDRFRMIRKPLPCSPCLRHPTCAHFDCMTAIGVEETVRAVKEMVATDDVIT